MIDRSENESTPVTAVSGTNPAVGTPGLLLIGLGVAAFLVSVGAFAAAWVGVGTWAGIAALLSSAAGLAWLSDEGRRQRGSRPLIRRHRNVTPPPTAEG